MYISYVAENSQTKEQYHVGTITYNTVLQKWMSEISEGNKFYGNWIWYLYNRVL
jgi:hypothetical protein